MKLSSALLLALGTLAFTSVSQAEVFRCTFTEPFLTITYDTASQKLTVEESGTPRKKVSKNISFQVAGPNVFLLKTSKGKEVARLELNNEGSDGMSDLVYPYSSKFADFVTGANNGLGGCVSTLLKTTGQN